MILAMFARAPSRLRYPLADDPIASKLHSDLGGAVASVNARFASKESELRPSLSSSSPFSEVRRGSRIFVESVYKRLEGNTSG